MDAVEAWEHFRVGVQLTHRTRYHEAILSFERALSLKPDTPLAMEWLGVANFRAGYVEPALSTWRDLIGSPEYATAVLESRVDFISYRRGIAADLAGPSPYAVAYSMEARIDGEYVYRRPVSIRPGPEGGLLLTALASNRIVALDVNGRLIALLDGGLVGYDKPFDVLSAEGGFYVSEFGANRIAWCDESGRKIRVIEEAGTLQILGPQYLVMDDHGYLYVSDAGNRLVHKFDSSGGHVLSFGPLEGPTGLAILDDLVYVAEHELRRIRVYDTSGNYLRSYGEGVLLAPEGLALSGRGTLLVADTTRIMELDLQHEVWQEIGDLSGIAGKLTSVALGVNGDLYAVDMNLEKVFALSELTHLISGYEVRIERVDASSFRDVLVEVSVTDISGRPIVGLTPANFVVSEMGDTVADAELLRGPTDRGDTEVCVLIDGSGETEASGPTLRSALTSLRDVLDPSFHLRVVGGADPRLVSLRDAPRLQMIQAAVSASGSGRAPFDEALRAAAVEVAGHWAERGVVYITSGALTDEDFESYSLSELASYLLNNHIGLWVIALGTSDIAPELYYLCESSGGGVHVLSQPRGLLDLPQSIRGRSSSLYVFSYSSPTFPDFGQRYIECGVEAVLHTRSGRDRSGYFAPLEF